MNAAAGHVRLLDLVMSGASEYGVPILVAVVVAQWWSRRDRAHVRHASIAAGLSFLLGLGLNQVILLFVHRVRPYAAGVTHLIIAPSHDPSFPSDHATAAFAVAAAFLVQGLSRRGLALLAAAVLISASRVYVGTHYVSDVLGGLSTGVAAAILVRALYWEGTRVDLAVTRIL